MSPKRNVVEGQPYSSELPGLRDWEGDYPATQMGPTSWPHLRSSLLNQSGVCHLGKESTACKELSDSLTSIITHHPELLSPPHPQAQSSAQNQTWAPAKVRSEDRDSGTGDGDRRQDRDSGTGGGDRRQGLMLEPQLCAQPAERAFCLPGKCTRGDPRTTIASRKGRWVLSHTNHALTRSFCITLQGTSKVCASKSTTFQRTQTTRRTPQSTSSVSATAF